MYITYTLESQKQNKLKQASIHLNKKYEVNNKNRTSIASYLCVEKCCKEKKRWQSY